MATCYEHMRKHDSDPEMFNKLQNHFNKKGKERKGKDEN